MDQLTDVLVGYFTSHPKLIIYLVIFIFVNTLLKAIVDAVSSSRAQWDKTPDSDDTWFEKALTWAVRIVGVIGKIAAYLVGVRSKIPVKEPETK